MTVGWSVSVTVGGGGGGGCSGGGSSSLQTGV